MLTWLIDLDNTLHNASHAVFPVMHANMNRYMAQLLGDGTKPADEALVNATRMMYWKKYGATLPGLMRHHQVNPSDFLHQTHQFENLAALLRYEAGLRRFFRRLPGRKILLTNAPRQYAQQVVRHLGIHRHFDQHISIESMYIHRRLRPKPSQWLLKKIIAKHSWRAQQCVLIEDTLDNLRAAKRLGMKTVWVTQYVTSKTPFRRAHFIDLKVRSVQQIPAKLAYL
jgi:putative hydrolase of the HAD superfamily